MVRSFKYHERKLLKKVDFMDWKADGKQKAATIMSRFYIRKRTEFVKYVRLCGHITAFVAKIRKMDPKDPFRLKLATRLLNKLYDLGLIPHKSSLSVCDKLSVSAFCRRRLPVVMVRNKMVENLKTAVTFVEQGHVRIGPNVVTDPAMLVTRNMEDFVTWVDNSKIRRKVLRYREQLDDYDIM